jgi:hypothetical protein
MGQFQEKKKHTNAHGNGRDNNNLVNGKVKMLIIAFQQMVSGEDHDSRRDSSHEEIGRYLPGPDVQSLVGNYLHGFIRCYRYVSHIIPQIRKKMLGLVPALGARVLYFLERNSFETSLWGSLRFPKCIAPAGHTVWQAVVSSVS